MGPGRDLDDLSCLPATHEIYESENYEYPIASGDGAGSMVRSWGSFEADPVNLSTIAKLRSEALRFTELADFEG
ncbi:hypothetical protein [uncultured Planktomarina sp.]|uniref:hypothetical protein n=1 Tax=uncultured Planktomarina sp. TaxID=1538529 RepID=UPI00326176A5